MNKIITLCLALSFLFSYNMQAQLANGSTAPDFTAEDIDGNTWNLYELLEDGKSVVLDMSATWCGPCWDFHQSGALEDLYEERGPDGTDEIRVFMIEGDGDTNTNCLYGSAGCNDATWGDWVTGTTYPIIDNDGIADDYQVGAFPTSYVICADKIVTGWEGYAPGTTINNIINALDGCIVEFGVNNAQISNLLPPVACGADLTYTPEFDLFNVGSADLTSATFQLYLDGVATGDPHEWTGSLSTFSSDLISMDEISAPSTTGEISVSVLTVNGGDDDDAGNNDLSASVSQSSNNSTTEITITFNTDCWPGENTWTIRNVAGATVASGGPYTSATSEIVETISVPAEDCYSFEFVDDFGDGLHGAQWTDCGVDGSIEVVDDLGLVLYWYDGSYDVTSESSEVFSTVTPVSVDNPLDVKVTMTPNPTNGLVNIALGETLEGNTVAQIFSIDGKVLQTQELTQQTTTIDLSAYNNGVYLVRVVNDNNALTQRIALQK